MKRAVKEQTWKQAWRPAAAYIYLLICIMDFIVFPGYYSLANNRATNTATVEEALKFKDSASQIEALKVLRREQTWTPLTTTGAGMIHLAFGSILGVAAWTRGKEKIALVNNGGGFEGPSGPSEGHQQ